MDVLRDRTALLTGAAGGIGEHLAEGLARRGVHLALSGRNVEALERLAERVLRLGARAEIVPADLGDPDAAAGLVARAEAAVGPLDLLVNNAGIENVAAYTRNLREDLERIVAVNLTAPMLLVHAALPGMLERGAGHVVNIASLAGKAPTPFNAPYSATKAGLVVLTQSLRAEYRDAPVGFSVICPGFIAESGMYARMRAEGHKAPATLGSVPPQRVVAATLQAIERDQPVRLVSPVPLRPLLAVNELLPRLGEHVVAVNGLLGYFRRVAEARGKV